MNNKQKYPPYPTENHQEMIAALDIQPHEKVLDVGGGHHPFCRANVVADIDFDSGQHRDGTRMMIDLLKHGYVQADMTALPFKDKSFDIVICIQALEHVADPAKACEELMRVADRGFIETPRKWTEYYAGHPTHRWLIDEVNNVLTFEPVTYNNSPFLNFALPALWGSPELLNALNVYRDIPCVQIVWTEKFEYQVRGDGLVSEASEAERHYYFARNLLHWMAPAEQGLYHAARAAQLMPDVPEYKELHEFYLLISNRQKFSSNLKLIAYALLYRLARKSINYLNGLYKQIMKLFPK